MVKSKVFAALLLLLSVCGSGYAYSGRDIYRIEFAAPVDTTFISGNSINVNILVYDRDNQLRRNAFAMLTVRTIRSNGSVGELLVDDAGMNDHSDGSYSYSGIDVRSYDNTVIEIRVRVITDFTQNNYIENRIRLYHGDGQNPNGMISPWKVVYNAIQPKISVNTTFRVSVNAYNALGNLLSSPLPVWFRIMDFSGSDILGPVSMTLLRNGTYKCDVSNNILTAGNNYFFECVFSDNVRTAIFVEADTSISQPSQPVLIPITPREITNYRPLFRWHPVNPLDSPSFYTLQVSTDSLFVSPLISIPLSDTFYTPLVNLPVGVIYWRVGNGLVPAGFSPFQSFRILDGTNIPILVSYTPDPTLERRPVLCWHAVSGASSYSIRISTGSGTLESPTSDTSFTPAINLPTTMIVWQVRSNLGTDYSGQDTFTILPDSIPFLVPFDGDTVQTVRPSFVWRSVSNTDHYRIEISESPDFRAPVISTLTSDTIYNPLINLDNNTLYYWHVSTNRGLSLYGPNDSVFVLLPSSVHGHRVVLTTVPALCAAPNPFKGRVELSLAGADKAVPAFVRIFDISGKLVTTLTAMDKNAGHVFIWDGRDAAGVSVRSGIYLVQASVGKTVLKERIVLTN